LAVLNPIVGPPTQRTSGSPRKATATASPELAVPASVSTATGPGRAGPRTRGAIDRLPSRTAVAVIRQGVSGRPGATK
jgi:hypothetical protein